MFLLAVTKDANLGTDYVANFSQSGRGGRGFFAATRRVLETTEMHSPNIFVILKNGSALKSIHLLKSFLINENLALASQHAI